MTEAEWLVEWFVPNLTQFLSHDVSARKSRLFGVACCRRIASFLAEPQFAIAIDTCERQADADIPELPLSAVARAVASSTPSINDALCDDAIYPGDYFLGRAIEALAYSCFSTEYIVDYCREAICGYDDYASQGEALFQADLFRDIFGNPFRSVVFAPDWRTSTTFALAESMYAARDFGIMPILADALEEIGCDNPDVLAHCRGDGTHVRGCWVIDLVLGKS